MRRILLIIAGVFAAIILVPILFRKSSAFLGSFGGKDIIATRSIVPNIKNGQVSIYLGDDKVFGLWEDAFDGPLFIYPFADSRRYLCVYNWDVGNLVFIVDMDSSQTNLTNWPANYATNVLLETKGVARFASDEELDEVSGFLKRTSINKIKAASLPYRDFGIWRGYMDKDRLLSNLATNRQNYYRPVPGNP